MLNNSQTLSSFSLAKEGNMPLVNEYGQLYIHNKTGGKVIFVKSEDELRSFDLVFDTPLLDNTGVRHIIEHSVLCGSEKYKSKDPFIDVRKGSAASFMNAFTGMNTTSYIFSTSNEKDFFNLMDFYLDACFNPTFVYERLIFEGEGWHYEFDDNEKLIINGVVYNEMKKIQTDKSHVISQRTFEDILPGTYATYNSGGDIKFIPKLTHQKAIDYYETYYHPANAILVVYGKLDVNEVLSKVDEYYSAYENDFVYSSKASLKAKEVVSDRFEHTYPAVKSETESNEKIVEFIIKIDETVEDYEDILLDNFTDLITCKGGYSLYDLVCEQGLASKISSVYNSLPCGKFISIACEGVKEENVESIEEKIRSFFTYLLAGGMDLDALSSFIKDSKFNYFRNDIPAYGKKIVRRIALACIDNCSPFETDMVTAFDYIEEKLKTDKSFFENEFLKFFCLKNLIKIIFTPDDKFSEKLVKNEKERLSRRKRNMLQFDVNYIKTHASKLNEYRLRKETEETLNSIPKISIDELNANPKWDNGNIQNIKDRYVRFFKVNTRDITTVRFYFDIDGFSLEEFKILKVITRLIFNADTKKYNVKKIEEMSKAYLLVSHIALFFHNNGKNNCSNQFCVEIEFKNEDVKNAMNLMLNIFKEIEFQDKSHIISEMRNMRDSLMRTLAKAPDAYVEKMLRKNLSSEDYIFHEINSLNYVNYLGIMANKYEKGEIDFGATLRRVSKKLFSWVRFSSTVISNDEKVFDDIKTKFIALNVAIGNRKFQNKEMKILFEKNNVGLSLNTLVNYVGARYNYENVFGENQFKYMVIESILLTSYLWDNVRLLGGAYGCKIHMEDGALTVVSYRDMQYEKTLDVFNGIANYLANFDEDITKYIVATYAKIERYNSIYFVCDRVDNMTRKGIDEKTFRKNFKEMLNMTSEDVRFFGRNLLGKTPDSICIASNHKKITEDKNRFDVIVKL